MNKIQTDDPRFVRDINSKALLATDKAALNNHRVKRMRELQTQQQMQVMNAQINNLQESVSKIENLLKKVIEKDNNVS